MSFADASWSDAPQAQKDFYNGIEFRSKLESKTAQALDNIGIAYVYEPDGYKLSNGMWYKPDFYLPDANQFLECKGHMESIDSAKIVGLVEDTGKPVVVLSYDNSMIVMHPWGESGYGIVTYQGDSVCLAWCAECGKPWFMSVEDDYECRNCGRYDGDHHLRDVAEVGSATELFALGQRMAADKPIYKEIAERFNN